MSASFQLEEGAKWRRTQTISKTTRGKMKEKQRIQIYFEAEAVESLDAIQRLTGLPTRAEAVRYTVGLFQWFVQELKSGSEIMLKRPGQGLQGIAFPFLPMLIKDQAAKSGNSSEGKKGNGGP